MTTRARSFSTLVRLPCTVFCGPDAAQKLSGTAVRIEPGSMILLLTATSGMFPTVGDKLELDVHLPVNFELAGAKNLSIRGQVLEVTETVDGARQLVLSFRRANFTDRIRKEPSAAMPKRRVRAASEGWEM